MNSDLQKEIEKCRVISDQVQLIPQVQQLTTADIDQFNDAIDEIASNHFQDARARQQRQNEIQVRAQGMSAATAEKFKKECGKAEEK